MDAPAMCPDGAAASKVLSTIPKMLPAFDVYVVLLYVNRLPHGTKLLYRL